jgi:3',5'-cyclic AMP phosphodiesterase CpdA
VARLILLSDLHLSPLHGYFWQNWCLARDAANAADPDFVLVNGDLTINGADDDAEIAFVERALRSLTAPTLVLPGNHDVGDEPPGQDTNQIVSRPRLMRWHHALGTGRFSVETERWRLIGINAQLWGSALPEEKAQEEWLVEELARDSRPVVLFSHKPLFLDSPDEEGPTTDAINPEPRSRLMAILRAAPVRMVVSGHLHGHRDRELGGVRYLWLPSTAFLGAGIGGSIPMVAAMSLDLSGQEPAVDFIALPGLVPYKLSEIKQNGRYPFLRDTPPCPPLVDWL